MSERFQALDALRGFALLGIILGNVTWFSGTAVASPEALEHTLGFGALDRGVEFCMHVFVDGKFYGLFSLIFGAGFALMVDSAGRRGLPVNSLVRRRLIALAGIGLVHASFVWFGDIISLYAVAAVPLYWMRRWTTRKLAAAAVVCLSTPVVVRAVLLVIAFAFTPQGAAEAGYGPAALLPAFGGGSYLELLAANWVFLRERWVLALSSSRLFRILGLFVLGMLAVRLRPSLSARRRGALVLVALAANFALALLAGAPMRPPTVIGLAKEVIYSLAVPLGAVAYAACLWPALSRTSSVTRALAAAGRLSLTHYVGQSIAMGVIFYGCGFALWGRLGVSAAIVVAAFIVCAQVAVSRAWLNRFAQGPGEWLLRRLSYLR